MTSDRRVRINYTVGEIEIVGDEQFIQNWWDNLSDDIDSFRSRQRGAASQAQLPPPQDQGGRDARGSQGALQTPETFGEFMHQFPPSITDIERALVAAFFAQSRESNNSFSTGNVNELLLQHGVRLANPSASVKRNVDARRVIPLGGGNFRVSQTGIAHLISLSGSNS